RRRQIFEQTISENRNPCYAFHHGPPIDSPQATTAPNAAGRARIAHHHHALNARPRPRKRMSLSFLAGVGDNALISLDFGQENGFGFRSVQLGFRSVRLGFRSAWAWISFSPAWNLFREPPPSYARHRILS